MSRVRRALLAAAALVAAAAPAAPDAASGQERAASRIRAGQLRYRVLFEGKELGTLTVRVRRTPDGNYRVRERVRGPLGRETSRYEMTPDLRPLSSSREGGVGPVPTDMRLTYREGRVTGKATVPVDSGAAGAGGRPTVREVRVNAAVGPGTVDGNMVVASVLARPLEPGARFTFPVFRPGRGVVEARAEVEAGVTVEVPAGRFDAYRVRLRTDQGTFFLYVTRSAPRFLVRQTFRDRPVAIDLTEVGPPKGEGEGDGPGAP